MGTYDIRFSDGAVYDAMMGTWSRSVGSIFLDWLHPEAGLDWIDVGCGSGAFTSLIAERCAPRSILGIDPSEAQLEFARRRGLDPIARFASGDAMALAAANNSMDAAVAALVVHFMPDPARGIAEMARVVRPGGLVAAYAWDLGGGGFPYEAVHAGFRSLGLHAPDPPHPEAADAPELERLWRAAGLDALRQRDVSVSRPFRDFEEYWQTATGSPRIAAVLGGLSPERLTTLKVRVRDMLHEGRNGAVVPNARANVIAGRVPRVGTTD
jgi:SAM-dependent methyltransferase